jgi:hypothetical protein
MPARLNARHDGFDALTLRAVAARQDAAPVALYRFSRPRTNWSTRYTTEC